MRPQVQTLPRSGAAREVLREKGQFWTPDWIAEAMVGYLFAGGATRIFDPAVGEGAFFQAALDLAHRLGRSVRLSGCELDQRLVLNSLPARFPNMSLDVEVRDFVLSPPAKKFAAIVANPPYIRHHRLPRDYKENLKHLSFSLLGQPIDGRAGLHVYFLMRALTLLEKGGRLAFILPADVCEGVFASALWNWITGQFKLDAVVTFSPDATPFPGVDTNAVIVLLEKSPPVSAYFFVCCNVSGSKALTGWTLSNLSSLATTDITIERRALSDGLVSGLSRLTLARSTETTILGEYMSVLRGIASGANEFFFLTRAQIEELEIPCEFFVRAIGRTRDINGAYITQEDVEALDHAGRPTYLLSLGGRPKEDFPVSVQRYLARGETLGLPQKALISSRRPWFKMERREIPPFLFAYLGRRNSRFIRNLAGVVPLTGFLCVYPRLRDADYVEQMWRILNDPSATAALASVGKTYGGGAVKVEPRALERLPLSTKLMSQVGVEIVTQPSQIGLL